MVLGPLRKLFLINNMSNFPVENCQLLIEFSLHWTFPSIFNTVIYRKSDK